MCIRAIAFGIIRSVIPAKHVLDLTGEQESRASVLLTALGCQGGLGLLRQPSGLISDHWIPALAGMTVLCQPNAIALGCMCMPWVDKAEKAVHTDPAQLHVAKLYTW